MQYLIIGEWLENTAASIQKVESIQKVDAMWEPWAI